MVIPASMWIWYNRSEHRIDTRCGKRKEKEEWQEIQQLLVGAMSGWLGLLRKVSAKLRLGIA
jgi:hypothetical protein